MTPEIGRWYRITSGPQRNRSGVVDNITDYAVGTRYRLTNRDGIVGRFPAEMLEAIPNPSAEYEPQVVGAPRQAMLDLMTRRVS